MRLDKFLAHCNVGTRSEVKKMIRAGLVKVGDEVVKSAETKVSPTTDVVSVNGKVVFYEKYSYFLLNKPVGCVTAVTDNVHTTVMKYLEGENLRDCAPVGRLDIDTEGLLIITNDGELAHHLLSPAHHVKKSYLALLDVPCPTETIVSFAEGIDIGDDEPTLPALLEILPDNYARLTISEGRFHQVKRMFKAVGCEVLALKRESMGGLTLGGLKPGEYRRLTEEEVIQLKKNGE